MIYNFRDFLYTNDFPMRLDRWLKREFQGITQGIIEKSIRNKLILLNSQKVSASINLKNGDTVSISPICLNNWEKISKQIESSNTDVFSKICSSENHELFKAFIIKETSDYMVLNKPSGLDVQGGWRVSKSLDTFIKQISPEYRLVHRLDRETSGVLVIAKNLKTAIFLNKKFKEQQVQKIYRAIVLGVLEQDSGVFDFPLSKPSSTEKNSSNNIVKVDLVNGQEAITTYKILRSCKKENWSEVELKPRTGRKHQLRVHLQYAGHPIVGDKKYDTEKKTFYLLKGAPPKKMFLHALSISFKNFQSETCFFSASLPSYWPS